MSQSSNQSDCANNGEPVRKPIRKLVSAFDVSVSVDTIVRGGAPRFVHAVPNLTSALEKLRGDIDPAQLTPDDIDWDDPVFGAPLAALGKLLSHDYAVEPAPGQRNSLNAAMNTPFICALDYHARDIQRAQRILVIGADRGQNLNQIDRLLPSDSLYHKEIVCVEPNRKVLTRLRETLTSLTRNGVILDCTFQEAMGGLKGVNSRIEGEFDVILHNLGLHVTCPNAESRAIYARMVEEHLSPTGVLIGTTIDLQGAVGVDVGHIGKLTHMTEVMCQNDPDSQCDEGSFVMRMGGTYFHDPVLSVTALHEMLGGLKRNLHVLPARYFMRHWQGDETVPRCTPPRNLIKYAKRAELAMVLVVLVQPCSTEARPHDRLISFESPPGDTPPHGDYDQTPADRRQGVKWVEVREVPGNVASHLRFSYNHGKPFHRTDLVYARGESTMIAPKWNGYSARMVVMAGATHLQVSNGRMFRLAPNGVGHREVLELQCEVLFSSALDKGLEESLYADWLNKEGCVEIEGFPHASPTNPFIRDEPEMLRVMVVDVHRIGYRTPAPFLSRWLEIKRLYQTHPAYEAHFELQGYSFIGDKMHPSLEEYLLWGSRYVLEGEQRVGELLLNPLTRLVDGVVFQPTLAPPGAMRDGAGSARYSKWEWTADILIPGGKIGAGEVIEVRLCDLVREEGKISVPYFVKHRRRYDKKEGNTLGQIKRMEEAEDPVDVIKFLELMTYWRRDGVVAAVRLLNHLYITYGPQLTEALPHCSPQELMMLATTDFCSVAYPRLLGKYKTFGSLVSAGVMQQLVAMKNKVINYVYHELPRLMQAMGEEVYKAGEELGDLKRAMVDEFIQGADEPVDYEGRVQEALSSLRAGLEDTE